MVITKASNLIPLRSGSHSTGGELPFNEVLLGQGKAAFCDRDHRRLPVRPP
jgi:hypothetical protein